MPTPETEPRRRPRRGREEVAEHASSLARLELELAALEVKQKVASLVGIGLGARQPPCCCVFALGFVLAAIAAGLATALAVWLALLIVTGGLFLVAGLLGLLGDARDQEGDAAGAGAGDRGGQADDRGAEGQWHGTTDAHRSRSAARSRPSANGSAARSTTCASDDGRRREAAGASCRSPPPAHSAQASSSAGGIGATMRLLVRRGREGRRKPAAARSPLSTATEQAAAPPEPARSSRGASGSRLQAHRQAVHEGRLHGTRQQVAYSSLLAFFPAVVLLVGLLGLFHRRIRLAGALRRLGRPHGGARHDRLREAGRRAEQERLGDRLRRRAASRSGRRPARWAR